MAFVDGKETEVGDDRVISLRRSLQQVKHCIEEALAVVTYGEDLRSALDDLGAAQEILAVVKKRLFEHVKAGRG